MYSPRSKSYRTGCAARRDNWGLTPIQTDVLIIGAGGAGMYAALAAARAGARVLLADRSLIGRGGATGMAQMTVAVGPGPGETHHWSDHLQDTPQAGKRAVGAPAC